LFKETFTLKLLTGKSEKQSHEECDEESAEQADSRSQQKAASSASSLDYLPWTVALLAFRRVFVFSVQLERKKKKKKKIKQTNFE
jgi:hypothetical protein